MTQKLAHCILNMPSGLFFLCVLMYLSHLFPPFPLLYFFGNDNKRRKSILHETITVFATLNKQITGFISFQKELCLLTSHAWKNELNTSPCRKWLRSICKNVPPIFIFDLSFCRFAVSCLTRGAEVGTEYQKGFCPRRFTASYKFHKMKMNYVLLGLT